MEVFSDGCDSARMHAFFIVSHEVLLCTYVPLVHKQRVIFYALFSYVKMLCLCRAVFHWTDLETVCVVPRSFSSLLPFIGSTVYLAVAAL